MNTRGLIPLSLLPNVSVQRGGTPGLVPVTQPQADPTMGKTVCFTNQPEPDVLVAMVARAHDLFPAQRGTPPSRLLWRPATQSSRPGGGECPPITLCAASLTIHHLPQQAQLVRVNSKTQAAERG